MNQSTENAAGSETFDAIVVGSGATGGWAAKKLTEAGMKVALLEAGKKITPKDFTEHKQPWDMPYLGMAQEEILKDRPIQGKCYACTEYNYKWFVNDKENPYTTSDDKPFWWIRQRVLGGRSMSWGRQSYRMGPLDFKAASHDGYGDDWPVTYEEMVPYFEEVERYVGITGMAENLLQLPDSLFLPPMPMTCGEILLRNAAREKMNRVVTMGRAAILTKPQNGRQACHYCGPCERGCTTSSYFSSVTTTIPDAMKTGRLTLITNAVAASIVMADGGKAKGVRYIDSETKDERTVSGKVVVLCASTLESTRLLLNSNICNSSGVLGHYLMDHIYGGGATGTLPVSGGRPWAGMPRRPNGIYVPRFRNVTQKSTEGPRGKFIRGYGYQGGSSASFNFDAPGFGKAYKDGIHETHWSASLGLWGECLARKENFVEIDRERKDAYGIPVLKISAAWGDNEKALFHDGQQQAVEMLEAAGAKDARVTGEYSVPGFCIHEIGTARMGTDPKTSVLNRHNQAWDVENIFVTDGAAWVSSGCANPTLTMMAITVRACDYIVNEYAKKLA
jgi:choline dehydrogenase-like flavoprotein